MTSKKMSLIERQRLLNPPKVDICFVLDRTHSMGRVISGVAESLCDMMDRVNSALKDGTARARVAFVAYGDFLRPPYDNRDHVLTVPFMDDFSKMSEIIMHTAANTVTGWDEAEDVAGGFLAVTKLEWKAPIRLVIHTGDRPGHGSTFYRQKDAELPIWKLWDRFPDGDPMGLELDRLMMVISQVLNIDYYFFRLSSSKVGDRYLTDTMFQFISDRMKDSDYACEQYDLGSPDSEKALQDLLNRFQECIVSSLTHSAKRKETGHRPPPLLPGMQSEAAKRYQRGELSLVSKGFEMATLCIHESVAGEKSKEFKSSIDYIMHNLKKPILGLRNRSVSTSCPFHLYVDQSESWAGAERIARPAFLKILCDPQEESRDDPAIPVVVKEFLDESRASGDGESSDDEDEFQESTEAAATVQLIAAEFANTFNQELEKRNIKSQIKFLPMYVIKTRGKTRKYYMMEPYIPGKFEKVTHNDGSVDPSRCSEVLAAFSHWTIERSNSQIALVDLQGSGNFLTDPAIHCKWKAGHFGDTDLGPRGIKNAKRSHLCGPLCRKLGLQPFKKDSILGDDENRTNDQLEEALAFCDGLGCTQRILSQPNKKWNMCEHCLKIDERTKTVVKCKQKLPNTSTRCGVEFQYTTFYYYSKCLTPPSLCHLHRGNRRGRDLARWRKDGRIPHGIITVDLFKERLFEEQVAEEQRLRSGAVGDEDDKKLFVDLRQAPSIRKESDSALRQCLLDAAGADAHILEIDHIPSHCVVTFSSKEAVQCVLYESSLRPLVINVVELRGDTTQNTSTLVHKLLEDVVIDTCMVEVVVVVVVVDKEKIEATTLVFLAMSTEIRMVTTPLKRVMATAITLVTMVKVVAVAVPKGIDGVLKILKTVVVEAKRKARRITT